MQETTNWHGPVFKRWIDADEFEQQSLGDFPVVDEVTSRTQVTTRQEAEQIQETGESERFVYEDGEKHLRRIMLREDAVLDRHQVFIEQTADGRESDRIHFVEGTDRSIKEQVDCKEDSIVTHIGSVREYFEAADTLSYNLRSGTQVPKELFGYLNQISTAYEKVTA